MSEFLFFLIGTMLGSIGSIVGVVAMCLMQINRLSNREEEMNEEKKRTDTFPSE